MHTGSGCLARPACAVARPAVPAGWRLGMKPETKIAPWFKLSGDYAEIHQITQNLRRHYAELTQPLRRTYAAITQILRSHYADFTQTLRRTYAAITQIYAIITQPLRNHYAAVTQSLRNHYAMLTQCLRNSITQHYAIHYAIVLRN